MVLSIVAGLPAMSDASISSHIPFVQTRSVTVTRNAVQSLPALPGKDVKVSPAANVSPVGLNNIMYDVVV